MISRYTRPQMEALWSEENRFKKMLEVEVCAVEALAQSGVVPKSAAQKIRRCAKVDAAKVREIESRTRHDVAAFVGVLSTSDLRRRT